MVYLDWAATSPPEPEILAEAARVAAEEFGNPSSRHALGSAARAKLEEARQRLAAAISTGAGRRRDGVVAPRLRWGGSSLRAAAPKPTASPSSPCCGRR